MILRNTKHEYSTVQYSKFLQHTHTCSVQHRYSTRFATNIITIFTYNSQKFFNILQNLYNLPVAQFTIQYIITSNIASSFHSRRVCVSNESSLSLSLTNIRALISSHHITSHSVDKIVAWQEHCSPACTLGRDKRREFDHYCN